MNRVQYEERKGIYKNAVEKWGAENQMEGIKCSRETGGRKEV